MTYGKPTHDQNPTASLPCGTNPNRPEDGHRLSHRPRGHRLSRDQEERRIRAARHRQTRETEAQGPDRSESEDRRKDQDRRQDGREAARGQGGQGRRARREVILSISPFRPNPPPNFSFDSKAQPAP